MQVKRNKGGVEAMSTAVHFVAMAELALLVAAKRVALALLCDAN